MFSFINLSVHPLIQQRLRKMPGALPLLSFTLSELHRTLQERWRREKSTDRALRDKDYGELGGVTKSLANRATQEYENLAKGTDKTEDERLQWLMRQILRRMVSLDGGGTRRRVLSSELAYPNDRDNQAMAGILKSLVDNQLVVAGQDGGETYYEPAHDSLVVNWIQEWMTPQAKEELALQRLLTPAAREWRQKETSWVEEHRSWSRITTYPVGKIWQGINYLWDHRESNAIAKIQQKSQVREDSNPKRFLWNGNPRLILLKLIFFSKFNNWLNESESQFVRTSVLIKRKNTALQWSTIVSSVTILASLTTVAMIGQRRAIIAESEASRTAAESNVLAHQDLEALVNGIRASKALQHPLLGITHPFLGITHPKETPEEKIQKQLRGTLSRAFYNAQEANRLEGHNFDVFQAIFLPNGKHLVSGGYDKKVYLWGADGQMLSTKEEHKGIIRSLAVSSDSQTIVSGDTSGFIHLWKITENKILHINKFKATISVEDGKSTIRSLSFHPNNNGWL